MEDFEKCFRKLVLNDTDLQGKIGNNPRCKFFV